MEDQDNELAGLAVAGDVFEGQKKWGPDWLQFFSGGVPSLDYFRFQVSDLTKLANESKEDSGLNITAELCIIGLAAHFESFCKNEFAAAINIFPQILSGFAEKRDCKLSVKSLLHNFSEIDHSLGFVIAEEYDFGSAKSVNGLFQDLLNITPFSTKEAGEFAQFLNDRNLLVHHGGIYTAKYKGQKFVKKVADHLINFDSLVVKKSDVNRWADFLVQIATKTGDAVKVAVTKSVSQNGWDCDEERSKAINALASLD